MANPTELSSHHERIAREAHRLAHRGAVDRNMKLVRDHTHGEGRVIPGTIASFIWAASSSVGGDPLEEADVDVIRRFLKTTHNIVALSRLPGEAYKFRLFISESWQEPRLEERKPQGDPDPITRGEEKLTPKEAGEDREPAPVLTWNIRDMKDNRKHLLLMIDEAEAVSESRGRLSTKLRQMLVEQNREKMSMGALSDAMKYFDDNGWVTRRLKGKRTYQVKITKSGHAIAELLREQAPPEGDGQVIDTNERVEPFVPQELSEQPSDGLGRSKVTVSDEYQERVNREVGEQRIHELADEAERGYDVDRIKERQIPSRGDDVHTIAQHISIYIENEVSRRMKEIQDPRVEQIMEILYSSLPPFQMLAEIDKIVRTES